MSNTSYENFIFLNKERVHQKKNQEFHTLSSPSYTQNLASQMF